MSKYRVPRGIRNNNPLNIVISSSCWLGKIPAAQRTDDRFEQFTDVVYGVRAALYLIRKYINQYNLDTITGIVNRWCPDSTADKYVRFVSEGSKIPALRSISFDDKDMICKIVYHMIRFENGQSIPKLFIYQAYDLLISK